MHKALRNKINIQKKTTATSIFEKLSILNNSTKKDPIQY